MLGQSARAEMRRHRDGVGAEEQRENRLQGGPADGWRTCFWKEAKGVGLRGAELVRVRERGSS